MAEKKTMVNDLTEGSVTKKLLFFALPFMLSNILQMIYNMVDMVVVGQFVGSAGLSAVSIGGQILMLLTTLSMGFSNSGQILISQLVGAKDREGMGRTIGTLFTTVMVLALVLTVAGLILHVPMLRLLNTPEEAMPEAKNYMLVCSLGFVFIYGYNMVCAVLRGMGDSKRPFVFIAIASVVNLILDIIFVGPLHMGAGGAALATVLAQGVSFLSALVYLFRRREEFGFDFALRSFVPDPMKLKILVRLGLPFALQGCAITVSMLFVNAFINEYGVTASAVFGAGSKIERIPGTLIQAVGFAASSMIGQNIGASKPERAQKVVYVSLSIGCVVYAIAAVLALAIPRQIFGIFTDDAAVLEMAPLFMLIMACGFPAHAAMTPFNSMIQGVGNATLSLIIALLDGVVVRIFLCILLGMWLNMGLTGYFLAYGMGAYATALVAGIYFFSGKWKKRKLLVS